MNCPKCGKQECRIGELQLELDELYAVRDNLAVLLIRLCRQCKDEPIADRAMNYLKRTGLHQRILREGI